MKALSPRQRIALHCRSCGSDPAAPGTWRQQIGLCPVTRCELWPVRPLPTQERPVTAELLAEYEVKSDDPALLDLKAKGLVQKAPAIPATALPEGRGEAIAREAYHREGSG